MNSYKTSVQQFVKKIGAEEIFAALRNKSILVKKIIPPSLRKRFPSFGAFIPPSTAYPKTDSVFISRDKVNFKVNRSDFVQWRLFYGTKDNALECAKKYIEPASIVLDIGANVGGFSLRLAKFCHEKFGSSFKIHAFEPNPLVFHALKENIALNKELSPFIQFHPIGITDSTGRKSFNFVESNTGAGRVMNSSEGRLEVQVQKLDEFVESINPAKIAFIKLIIEGSEPGALAGGWNCIQKYKPPVFLEVTRTWWGENNAVVEDVLAALSALGYEFQIELETEMRAYEPAKHSQLFQFNLLAKVK